MNDLPAEPTLPSSRRLIGTLGLVSMMSGLLVVLAFQSTAERIAENKRSALEKAIFSVLPGAVARTSYLLQETGIEAVEEGSGRKANLFAGLDEDGNLMGLALEGSARGYQDVVRILYGFDPERECIIGFTVLQSTETPGLGDRVEIDPGFLANFECLEARLNEDQSAMAHDIVTVKHGSKTDPWQIDAVSGATVTSKAIGEALRVSTGKLLPLLAEYWDPAGGAFLNGEADGHPL